MRFQASELLKGCSSAHVGEDGQDQVELQRKRQEPVLKKSSERREAKSKTRTTDCFEVLDRGSFQELEYARQLEAGSNQWRIAQSRQWTRKWPLNAEAIAEISLRPDLLHVAKQLAWVHIDSPIRTALPYVDAGWPDTAPVFSRSSRVSELTNTQNSLTVSTSSPSSLLH